MWVDMHDLLKKYFGYDAFRPLQEAVITHCLAKQDALVLMPTGGGKSLCFQLPALVFSGITIVISPLIALMKDQVDALKTNGITAAYLNSTLTAQESQRIEDLAKKGEIKLLYLAPERLSMPRTIEFLQGLSVSLFAIDEAHCISEWGHDFRPDYRNLRVLRERFPGVPLMALTATANPRVREDILKQLRLEGGKVFQSSFNRENLTYRVLPKKQAFPKLLSEIQERPGQSVIVYCFSRKGTEKVAADLQANGIKAAAYHAGLAPQERSRVQDAFIRDEVPVIAATIAFGMGIDKPDVRLVVHMDLPKSVEGYYQETGRAGRDGLPSECLLFFSRGDCVKQEMFLREMSDPMERQRAFQQLQTMLQYGESTSCRRAFLLNYFGETWTELNCRACDICVPRIEKPVAEPRSSKKQMDAGDFDQELFEQLRAKRRSLAEERRVPPYMIFGDRTLQDMARQLPQRMETMANVFGVGKEKLAQYGEVFLKEVSAFAQAHGLSERVRSPQAPPEVVIKKALSGRALETLTRFQNKERLEQIAASEGVTMATVMQHLEKAQGEGSVLDVSHVTFSSVERFQTIARAFQTVGTSFLGPVRQHLGEAYSYEELRLVRLVLRAKGKLSTPA